MPRTTTGTVYTLTDPRDGTIRYVGKTTQEPLQRLAQHLASPSNPVMRVWFHTLALQGMTPRIDAIANPPLMRLSAEEQRQIKRHAKDGHRLFNSPYYHQNLPDLYQAAAPAPEALKRDDVLARKVDDYAHRVYGEIAASRAAGQLSRAQAAGRVLVRMPAVAFVFLWHLLASIPPVRWATKAALWCWAVWIVGFDRLLRDKVLPHLPMAAAASLWREYLAVPVMHVALTFLGCAVVAALLAYSSVYESAAAKRGLHAGRPQRKPLADDAVAAAAAAALDRAFDRRQES